AILRREDWQSICQQQGDWQTWIRCGSPLPAFGDNLDAAQYWLAVRRGARRHQCDRKLLGRSDSFELLDKGAARSARFLTDVEIGQDEAALHRYIKDALATSQAVRLDEMQTDCVRPLFGRRFGSGECRGRIQRDRLGVERNSGRNCPFNARGG